MYKEKSVSGDQVSTGKVHEQLLAYPVDMRLFIDDAGLAMTAWGVPSSRAEHWQPTTVIYQALYAWQQYMATRAHAYRAVFLALADWLVEHETRIDEISGGWLHTPILRESSIRGNYLSASTQGCGLAILVRAYQLTHDQGYRAVAQRVAHTFTRDILDGGVSTPSGKDGIFFEEVAVYPASHALRGFLFALLGLYDYLQIVPDTAIQQFFLKGVATLHAFIGEFEAGFWSYTDLLQRRLSSPILFQQQIALLAGVAKCTACQHCAQIARRNASAVQHPYNRLRYLLAYGRSSLSRSIASRCNALFAQPYRNSLLRICVAVPAFPFTGGVYTILCKIVQVTMDSWQIEYLTQRPGPDTGEFSIQRFGNTKASPRHFPLLLLYVLAGCWKLIVLQWQGKGYDIYFPQDGLFSAAFAVLAGKITGKRVVCMDHGTLTWLDKQVYSIYYAERVQECAHKSYPPAVRFFVQLSLRCYRPALVLLARIAAAGCDHFLVPGVEGDGVEAICQQLGIRASRLIRFTNMIEIERHHIPDSAARAAWRIQNAVPVDAQVIIMVCRLAPEKGIDIALESLSQALSVLPSAVASHVHLIIVGDGPMRQQIENAIQRLKLQPYCQLWGHAARDEVMELLGMSDIFLYTSRRGAGYPLSILEAMASRCAVIASTEPAANATLLAEGRGIAVAPDSIVQTKDALIHLLQSPALCKRMGEAARQHVATYHTPRIFRRMLLRATQWSQLDTIIARHTKSDPTVNEER